MIKEAPLQRGLLSVAKLGDCKIPPPLTQSPSLYKGGFYFGMVMVRTIWLSVSRRSEMAGMPHR